MKIRILNIIPILLLLLISCKSDNQKLMEDLINEEIMSNLKLPMNYGNLMTIDSVKANVINNPMEFSTYLNINNLNDDEFKSAIETYQEGIVNEFNKKEKFALYKDNGVKLNYIVYQDKTEKAKITLDCSNSKLTTNFINNKANITTKRSECSRNVSFDNYNLCLPKYDNWKECREDKNVKTYVDNLELNNKILGFYMPSDIYEKLDSVTFQNIPIISLFVQINTIGVETDKSALPMVFSGFKNSFSKKDFEYVEKQLKTKTNTEFITPTLFDSYDLSESAKTLTTINTANEKGQSISRISFINILDLRNRIMILNYSKELNGIFNYSEMKKENEEITDKLLQENK